MQFFSFEYLQQKKNAKNFRATGYSTMKIGKTAAFLIGGGIILLEVANEQGWIKIDCKTKTFRYL